MQAIYRKIVEEEAFKARRKKRQEDKPRYEYDSDEEIDGGTWEHKKRKTEMQKTLRKMCFYSMLPGKSFSVSSYCYLSIIAPSL